ncbi:1-acyl-sn-glycerol-3-phosphate acyltransferase beta-like [Spodoptera litura]|uniref:1-acylglycerol-3-phosphate O-acyltransferase n=1 Tax=Spodoptera litura TaxID=69820 RepID=A0A9J7EPT2_SPOLT|nr:1-acyl-sn-glycerol-3-phosphate acyltransferase beta-like [Spodoptera litura]
MLLTVLLSITVITLLVLFKSELKKVRFYIKFYFYYVTVSVVPLIIMPLLLMKPKHHSNGPFTSRYMRDFANFVYGWEWQIRNKEILMEDRGAVIISNHQSVFDSTGVNNVWVVAKKILLIVKKELLLYSGPLGLAMYLCGTIFIDRKNQKEAYQKLELTKQLMIHENYKTWIFPEGTRNTKCDGKLLPFRKGAFNLAVTAQVPIIPVVYSPYYFFDKDKYIFDKGRLILQCLEPVPTVGLTVDDVPALTERLHQIISRTYEQLSKEVLSDSRGK